VGTTEANCQWLPWLESYAEGSLHSLIEPVTLAVTDPAEVRYFPKSVTEPQAAAAMLAYSIGCAMEGHICAMPCSATFQHMMQYLKGSSRQSGL
jgi:hypothetical protein